MDRILQKFMPGLRRGDMYAALRKGKIRLNGKKARGGSRVREGDRISVYKSLTGAAASDSPEAAKAGEGAGPGEGTAGQTAPAYDDLLYRLTVREDQDLIFLDKPKGLASHGRNSLAECIEWDLQAKTAASLSFRPGPLHRLDRNTSGLITFSKTLFGAREFSRLLRMHSISKYYLGVCLGRPKDEELWEDLLNRNRQNKTTVADHEGREARMTVRTILEKDGLALCLYSPETGLTHQIRAQCSLHGYPLMGDCKYGGGQSTEAYFLHAAGLRINAETAGKLKFRPVYTAPPKAFYTFVQKEFGIKNCNSVLDEVESFVLRRDRLQ